ncbi:Do family serine endopeptidase [Oxalobacter aliiformigenes]|uniref:Do family serine endopeptidase n=1 Tax=Oxalobacter aliiformigenes TaxID=2946593 RepID=UPI0022AFAC41|nr:Do family serine endopeptidase [Oxalobacter aliiformigenes]MCZ4065433.1 Do family serine endopeptidase [Oxalobacter aliiformigenes]WAV99032.1 Do family serine endopeptidase [Oxalobacter aliiformigenes]
MRRLWLLFAQTITVCLAIWFVVVTLKPGWLDLDKQSLMPDTQVRESVAEAVPAQSSYREAVSRAMPAVVNIYTTKEIRQPQSPLLDDPFLKRFFGERFNDTEKQMSLGSGVVATHDGYILTNNHVVETADQIEVAFEDGRKAAAKLVGTDPETDLAVIKIDLPDLPAITFGDVENARVGDVVLAIGNPFGVGQTVTMGIISALGRSQLGINIYENFIQTDAAINPGNSGGALIDTSGNLLGINSAIYSRSGGSLGIGFAIPVSTVKTVMDAIISKGQVIRGWIGVEPRDITPELAENLSLGRQEGVIIAAVLKNGPADKAGVKPGDILVSVEGQTISNMSEMFNLIAKLKPDSKTRIIVLREGREFPLEIVVGKRPSKKKLENQSQ